MGEAGFATHRVACLNFQEGLEGGPRRERALAEACLQWSPQIAWRTGEAIFLEIGKCRHLFSEKTVAARLHALALRFGVAAPRISIENSSALAWAMTRYGSVRGELLHEGNWTRFPLEALSCFWDPFREIEEDVQKNMAAMNLSLERLGLRSLGEFCAFPSSGFASRFGRLGPELVARVRVAQVGDLAAWPGFVPEEKITEEAEADCENLEALVFVLRATVDRAMARLRGRNQRASVVQVKIEFENWGNSDLRQPRKKWEMKAELPVPQGSATGLLPILKDRLDFTLGQKALPAPARKVEFHVLETAPGRGAQKDFFSRKEEESEARDSLIARLAERLGAKRVFTARPVERHLPELAWERVSASEEGAFSARGTPVSAAGLDQSRRPTRLLSNPERLHKRGNDLTRPGGKGWTVLEWVGPERLSGEWWKELRTDPAKPAAGFFRDYYRAVTEGGEELWVFVDRGDVSDSVSGAMSHPVYLHGYFD